MFYLIRQQHQKWTETNDLNFAKFIVPAEGFKAAELVADDPGDKWNLYWSPDGKWISYNSNGFVKTRPEGATWEADVSGLLNGGEREQ